jgi:hypothetical protein
MYYFQLLEDHCRPSEDSKEEAFDYKDPNSDGEDDNAYESPFMMSASWKIK